MNVYQLLQRLEQPYIYNGLTVTVRCKEHLTEAFLQLTHILPAEQIDFGIDTIQPEKPCRYIKIGLTHLHNNPEAENLINSVIDVLNGHELKEHATKVEKPATTVSNIIHVDSFTKAAEKLKRPPLRKSQEEQKLGFAGVMRA